MALGTVQLFDDALPKINGGTMPLWTASASYYACLYRQSGSTPTRTLATKTAVDAAFTEVTVGANYARQAIANATVTKGSGAKTVFSSDTVSFGSSVTIAAKFLVIFQGTAASPAGSDEPVFWVDLNTASSTAEASSTAANFSIAPSANGWFYINGQ